MDRGGISTHMMNYYRHMDRSKIQIDFIVHGFEKGVHDDEIKSLGGQIYNVPLKSRDYFGNLNTLREIFNSGKYKIVHSHMDAMSIVPLKVAKECGIPIRIAHSHNTQHLTNDRIKLLLNEYARKNIKKTATHLFACSEDAGRWLYGSKAFNDGKVILINNAIELGQFSFSLRKRNIIREQLGLENAFVIGHIGRFDYQKNHIFLLEIFKVVLAKIPGSILLLIGDGHLRGQIEKRIKQLGIDKSVVLLGSRSDVSDLLNAFDLLLLPSLFEGLGIVLIEAQANGLKCIASNGIPQSANLTNLITYVSLEESAIHWAGIIDQSKDESVKRDEYPARITDNGYNIDMEAKNLMDIYISLLEDNSI